MASSGRSESGTDADLVAAIQRGDREAFRQLVERHHRSLISFFNHMSWDLQIAEDCTQEVFLRLFSHLGSYEPQAKFTTFLFRVARNLWIDRMRSGAVRMKPTSLDASDERGALKDRIRSSAETPVEILSRSETCEAVKQAIEGLPEEQRMVLVLSELQGLRYEEIAVILQIPVGTVKSRMHTAVERLKEKLKSDDMS